LKKPSSPSLTSSSMRESNSFPINLAIYNKVKDTITLSEKRKEISFSEGNQRENIRG